MADLEQKKHFIESLNTYYKLKSQYENNFNKEKNKISNIEGLSWKEKKTELRKIRQKCINCKRPVGSTFSTRLDKYERHLIAICGDENKPCPLNIDINVGIMFELNDMLNDDEISMLRYKKDIIIDKNDLLFGYIPTHIAVKKFDMLKEKITSTTNIYETALQAYTDIVDNPQKKEALHKLQTEFYANIVNYKSIIEQYKRSENTQLVNDAVELYINTMLPKSNEIMKKKYSYNAVEYNEDDNTYHLIQKRVTIEDMESDVGDDGETVVSLKIGLDAISTRKKPEIKTNAITAAIPGIKENSQPAPKKASAKAKATGKKILFVNTETERETGKMGEQKEGEEGGKGEEEEEEEKQKGGEYSDNESASNYSSESDSDSI